MCTSIWLYMYVHRLVLDATRNTSCVTPVNGAFTIQRTGIIVPNEGTKTSHDKVHQIALNTTQTMQLRIQGTEALDILVPIPLALPPVHHATR